MRESSPAIGGAITVAAVVWSLAYVMGDGHALMDFLTTQIGQASDAAAAAFDTLWQMLAPYL